MLLSIYDYRSRTIVQFTLDTSTSLTVEGLEVLIDSLINGNRLTEESGDTSVIAVQIVHLSAESASGFTMSIRAVEDTKTQPTRLTNTIFVDTVYQKQTLHSGGTNTNGLFFYDDVVFGVRKFNFLAYLDTVRGERLTSSLKGILGHLCGFPGMLPENCRNNRFLHTFLKFYTVCVLRNYCGLSCCWGLSKKYSRQERLLSPIGLVGCDGPVILHR